MRRDDILYTVSRFRARKQDESGIVRIGVFRSATSGESVKDLDEVTEGDLLSRYPQTEWKRIMGSYEL
ncbi:MAG: hypothetical protein U9R72_08460 [Chloroflexota bacterium]|nr:hypothetical protein [Chloroflexota bacterium]